MSQVAKLKELLFQPESEEIAKLSRKVDEVYQRAGSDAQFEQSIARSIDGALRTAEATKYDQVSTALAPLVVRTVKTEIRNSSDDIAEALYPSIGRMIRDYVAAQIREMTEAINRRLEENAFILRISALTSGQSAAELALAESRRMTVEDVLLIKRGTGELLARWPHKAVSGGTDNVLGGVLTAINDFTSEAFKSEGSSLREIDLGDSRVYLRVSPSFMLAARCKGTESAAAEKILDEEFMRLIERSRSELDALANSTAHGAARADALHPILSDLSDRVSERLLDIAPSSSARRGIRPLTLIAALIGLPLALWLAWGAYTRWVEASVVTTARGIIDATPSMLGFPAETVVASGGRVLTLQGLTPSLDVQTALVKRIAAALPHVDVRDRFNALPPGGIDVRPMLAEIRQDQSAFEAEVRSTTDARARLRAANLLGQAAAVLEAEAAAQSGDVAAGMVRSAREASSLAAALSTTDTRAVGAGTASTSAETREPTIARMAVLEAELSAASRDMLDTRGSAGLPPASVSGPADVLTAAQRVMFAAQGLADRSAVKRRLAAEAASIKAETAALRSEAMALKSEIAALAGRRISAREALVQFARSHALFFADGTTFRDPAAASRVLDDLAELMKRDGSLVRLVGYTDDAGSAATNLALGQSRAETVAAELTRRGIPSNRLVVLRRVSQDYNVSLDRGTGSANRRVEIEVGFVGEGNPG